jgi:exo-1,4-beta-D-glucosaminidase
LLEFPGINYRAEIWLNGQLIADGKHIVGMYAAHELNATQWIRSGQRNTLAVKVTPERAIQGVNGVELADSWFDWLNWKYLGYQGPRKADSHGISFVPDRNTGIWKPQAGASEMPTWRTLPWRTRSSRPRMTSSTGVIPSQMCTQYRSM